MIQPIAYSVLVVYYCLNSFYNCYNVLLIKLLLASTNHIFWLVLQFGDANITMFHKTFLVIHLHAQNSVCVSVCVVCVWGGQI